MSLSDKEMQWLKVNQGVVPATYNDMWYKWLGSEGYTGTYNDRWYRYAADRGISGALPDKLKELFCSALFNTPLVIWLLEGGTWNDEGVWLDDEVWEDS